MLQTSQRPTAARCPAALRDSVASQRQPYHAAPHSRAFPHLETRQALRNGSHVSRLQSAAEPQRTALDGEFASARASKAPASSDRSGDFAAGFQAKGLEADLFRELLLLASSAVGTARGGGLLLLLAPVHNNESNAHAYRHGGTGMPRAQYQ